VNRLSSDRAHAARLYAPGDVIYVKPGCYIHDRQTVHSQAHELCDMAHSLGVLAEAVSPNYLSLYETLKAELRSAGPDDLDSIIDIMGRDREGVERGRRRR